MSAQFLIAASLALALASALLAGVFQSFSDFVMRGLVSAPAAGGMASMQRINVTVMRSWFLTGFMLLVPASLGLAVYAVITLDGAVMASFVLAAVIYVLGAFGVTMRGNVPMNNRLADLPSNAASSQEYWQSYAQRWTRFNHLWMFACMATAACYMGAAMLLSGQAA